MNKLLTACALALAIGSTPANATLQIAFGNGASTFFCADQTACDLDGAAKNLLLLNTVVGNIKIVGTFATSMSHPDELSVSNLTITNLSGVKQTLDMALGDNGFSTPAAFIRSSASLTFLSDVGGSGSLSFFADKADAQPAANALDLPGLLLFDVFKAITSSPDSVSGTHDSAFGASGPFSMAEGAVLTLGPHGSITGFNETMAASAIPEPSTWGLMALGFGFLSFLGLRRRTPRQEFAA